MKRLTLNILALLFSPLSFAEAAGAQGGGGSAKSGATGYTPAVIFDSLRTWTPSQFREAVSPEQALTLVDDNKNTLLHRAIEANNVDITRMLVNKPYGLDPNKTNGVGETAVDMAREQGGEFAGIFKDIGE